MNTSGANKLGLFFPEGMRIGVGLRPAKMTLLRGADEVTDTLTRSLNWFTPAKEYETGGSAELQVCGVVLFDNSSSKEIEKSLNWA